MKFFAFVMSAAALAASVSLSAPAMAGGFTAVETHGKYIETYSYVNGGQLGVYQNGRCIGTYAQIYGNSAVALSQTGYGTTAHVAVRGDDNDVGATLSRGAQFSARIRGDSNGAAVYSGGGTVLLEQDGIGNKAVIQNY
ncbi:hypothetical protein ACVWWK_003077 [Bradyrhizobium sp. LB9.1b]